MYVYIAQAFVSSGTQLTVTYMRSAVYIHTYIYIAQAFVFSGIELTIMYMLSSVYIYTYNTYIHIHCAGVCILQYTSDDYVYL